MAVDDIVLAPESFRTIYLRREDRVILRTERGQKIIVKRIIPDDWVPYRIYEFDNSFLNQLTDEFAQSVGE